jgi:ribosomal protein L37AE/L43A
MPMIRRMAIDRSGMGLTIFEQLDREFPGKVEGVLFTRAIKEALAVRGKRRMEERKARLPDTDIIRNSFWSVKKLVTDTGQARFDATHDERFGHADHWWAYCLAESAYGEEPVYGLLEWYREEAERIRSEANGPPPTGEEIARELGRAQVKYAQDRGCFGAEKWPVNRIQQLSVPKPAIIAPTACPNCGNKALSRYSGLVRCNPCGWKSNI